MERRTQQARDAVARADEKVGSGAYKLSRNASLQYEELKRQLNESDAELEAAREELRALDRKASNAAVPREWRH